MDWAEVTALTAVGAAAVAVHGFVTKALVSEGIRKLNGTYLRSELANTKFAEIEKHFDYIRDELDPLTKQCPLLHIQGTLPLGAVPQARQSRRRVEDPLPASEG